MGSCQTISEPFWAFAKLFLRVSPRPFLSFLAPPGPFLSFLGFLCFSQTIFELFGALPDHFWKGKLVALDASRSFESFASGALAAKSFESPNSDEGPPPSLVLVKGGTLAWSRGSATPSVTQTTLCRGFPCRQTTSDAKRPQRSTECWHVGTLARSRGSGMPSSVTHTNL